MRTALVYLVALAAFPACKKESQQPPQPEPTTGQEIGAAAAPPEAMAMAAIEPGDVELEIWAIDVAQGDATLIVGPAVNGERFVILIDAGVRDSGRAVEPALEDAEIDGLDVVVATHYDDDHIGGFTTRKGTEGSVLWTAEYDGDELEECTPREFFPTVAIVDPGPGNRGSGAEREWADCVAELTGGTGEPEHVEVMNGANLGKSFDLGGGYTATIVAGGGHVLGTTGAIEGANSKNEMSVAVLVSNSEGFDFLVTGDLIGQPSNPDQPSALENAPLERKLGEKLKVDGVEVEILQVGHHGAANASDDSFITAIQPKIAIVSVGMKNSHGHPHNRTLATLESNNVPIILQTSAGKRRASDPPPHEFVVCADNDPSCTDTTQIAVNGTFHIEVAGDKYDIESLEDSSYYFQQEGVETLIISLECDATGCEGVVE